MSVTVVEPRKSMQWIKDSTEYYPHQIIGIRVLSRQRNFILADEMGLGKSLQALTIFAIDVVMGRLNPASAIVICPTSLKGNWSDEIVKFTDIPHMVLRGTPKERKAQLIEFEQMAEPKILVTNYEQIKAHLIELNKLRFGVAIFDEAHYLKNPDSQRTKASMALKSTRSFLLTGTPMLNRVNELWTLLHRCSPQEFPKYWNFTNHFCKYGGFKNKEIIGTKNMPELHTILDRYMLQRKKADVLDLPEVHVIERHVDLTKEQQELYDQVIDELRITRYGESESDEIENALTKGLRLKQICGTTLPFTGEDHSAKMDQALLDDLEILANGHKKIVVFSQFLSVIQCYADRLDAAGVKVYVLTGKTVDKEKRAEFVKTWGDDPEPAVLVCNVAVAGVGLNMTKASHASFLDQLYVPGLNQQAIDRLHRIGASTTQAIQVRVYIARTDIEQRVAKILSMKKRLNSDVLDDRETINWNKMIVTAMREELDK